MRTELHTLVDAVIDDIARAEHVECGIADRTLSRLDTIARVLGISRASFLASGETAGPICNPGTKELPSLSRTSEAIKDPLVHKVILDLTRVLAAA